MCVCSSSACLWLIVLIMLHNQTAMSNMHVPALTQVIAHAVLESWGYDKFRKHTEAVSMFYRKKRDRCTPRSMDLWNGHLLILDYSSGMNKLRGRLHRTDTLRYLLGLNSCTR